MNIEKEKLLIDTHQKFMETGLNSPESLDILDDIVAPDLMGFGTTADENIFSVADLKELINRQRQQSQGFRFHWTANPVFRKILNDGNAAVFVDDVVIEITINNDTVKMSLRYSSVMEYQGDKWVVVHFHGSKPENVKTEEDTWGIEKWKEKNAELEKLVNERTLELNQSLENLKEAQQQLIKSEKMAAFGSMATRMAHEIQNPLNFVNNFSELSKDLVDEIVSSKTEEEKNDAAKTLIDNLEKINQHGKRASSIISQLQEHSNKGTAHEFFES